MAEERKKSLPVVKFMELSISVACLVLHYYSFDDGDPLTGFLATGAFTGYIVILLAVFAGYLMRVAPNKRVDMFYSTIGSLMFVGSGVLILEAWEHTYRTRTRDLAILKGALAIVNGIVFFFDVIFTFKEK